MSDNLRELGERVLSRVENPDHRRRLENMVVDPSFAEDKYVSRTLPGGRAEADVYVRAMEKGKHPMLMGPAGSGKTWSPFNFASLTGLPLAVTEGHAGYDPERQWDYLEQNPKTGIWERQLTDQALVILYGGIHLVDELYRIPPKSSGALFAQFDDRRRIQLSSKETIKLADDLLLVSTTNPPSYAGVGDVDEALKDRHSPVLIWDYDPRVEAELLSSPSLQKMAKAIRDRGELETGISTRSLVEFEDLASDLGIEMAKAGLLGRYNDYDRMIVSTVVDNHAPNIAEELGL